MKKLVTIMSFLLLTLLTQANAADVNMWNCSLRFEAQGRGLQVFVGKFDLKGEGVLRCVNLKGDEDVRDVSIVIGGTKFAPSIGFGKLTMKGFSIQTGILNGADALLGKYIVAGARGSVLRGIGALTAVKAGTKGLTLNIGLESVKGFGFKGGLSKMVITEL